MSHRLEVYEWSDKADYMEAIRQKAEDILLLEQLLQKRAGKYPKLKLSLMEAAVLFSAKKNAEDTIKDIERYMPEGGDCHACIR